LFGSLYDMKNQVDLTASATEMTNKLDFSKLPLNKAIKTVKGNGKRIVAVFSDPECPYCKRLEAELGKVTDVTIYTFLYPLDGLHPEARAKAEAVWCSKDQSAAWQTLLLKGKTPEGVKPCATPIDDIASLASELGIQGTPYLITKDGRTMPGSADSARLNNFINEPIKQKEARND
jgi:thiol:disulfide interchange protein DsbC